MKDHENLNFESMCVHAGIDADEFGAVVPPIYQTSTFKFKSAQHGAALFSGEGKGHIYTRMSNPTIEAMEDSVAALEGGVKAMGCASGMAAINTVFATFLGAGSHVVCSQAVYGPTNTLLRTVYARFGVEISFVDTSNPEDVKAAMKENTRLVYVETPGNPTLAIADLAEIVKIAKEFGAKVCVDNTFMSPALQRPFEFGVDVIIHSMTKFLNGHADVVAGIVVAKEMSDYTLMKKVLNQTGGVIDPFNSFLVHRGIKTLAIRMEKHSENAQKVAEFLEKHEMVEWIKYPGLRSHPQYFTGLKQHKGHGGMITFELKGGYDAGEIMMNSVKLCQLAVSLGGVESLIQHPASMTHFSMGPDARKEAGITEGLVRLSVGIENHKDIIKDLERALYEVGEALTVKQEKNLFR
ncbi:MAG: aminotransferase class I/II-fold pyridoxal phosphate-dependent enzyme [Ignavibacteriales bacterium]|jgi:methionine-gamma-lyase|nr:aminotransferase class I/II-fold pyridoxal phosphate-dependent enzyme [Ignavibacteriales bacterium]MBP7542959.1 aminotransferase class I/II-fold pyridoxal phosphate-dependent enzyme [Ignavibacteriaceae bacterium]MBP9122232.1 aminotransferase class I/II-fold pyridoxal phosphate-dependent enzyme [Ignavibacteriaceae bacterium]MCC6638207.1 aminotransferase class I/II-fold pyridoxal phosphate-dependent enzyme [Ignavibacteriaceae bacterium]